MVNRCRVVGAGTSFPNTPESDLQPQVMNDVHVVMADGSEITVRVKATEPLVAIERVKAMTDEEVAALPRAPSA